MVAGVGPDFNAEYVDLLERALVALGTDHSAMRAMVMVHLASATIFTPGAAGRDGRAAEEAVRLARLLGDPVTLLRVLVKASIVLWREADGRPRALALANEITALGMRCPAEVDGIFAGHGIAFLAAFESGRMREAYAELDWVIEAAARSGVLVRIGAPTAHGMRAASRGASRRPGASPTRCSRSGRRRRACWPSR